MVSSIIDDFVYFDANFLGTSVGHYLVRINGNEQNNPSLISPINGSTGLDYNSVLTEWNYNNDSTSIAYIIFTLKEVDSFGSSNGTTIIFDENIGKTTSNALSNLSPNQWYKWWVELQFTDGSPPTANGGWFQTMMENSDDTKITQYEDDLTEDFGGTKDENCFDVGSADRITVFGSLNPNEPYWDRDDCFKFRVKQTGNYIFTFTIEMVDFYFYYYFGSLPYSTEVEIYGDLSTDEYDGIYFGDKGIQREIALTKDQYYFRHYTDF